MTLNKIYHHLLQVHESAETSIPSVWLDVRQTGRKKVRYADFLAKKIYTILQNEVKIKDEPNWSESAIVYNLFVRLFTAYDHDQDGLLGECKTDITLNGSGIRETGTFLKTIALLPYLKQLGVNTIHLLPITQIGVAGRKGDLGSPYAIKNPLKIDPLLADPIVDCSVDDQFSALVEAAHRLGMRVVQEFIFRTASIDSDWIDEHPGWFYWIKNSKNYVPPEFAVEDLMIIKQIPMGNGKHLPPPESYRKIFAEPPAEKNTDLTIASAFADWPPDDLQPPWTDVTYLRLYDYDFKAINNFNYIAYNTIRFYDPELAKPENRNIAVWEAISEIIPHYQKKFGIDGAMIDMGHALPNDLKKMIIHKARKNKPDFAFWDENFDNTIQTKNEGYNAVIGGSWYNITKRNGFRKEILLVNKKRPLPYFGTAETHNSPRYGFRQKSKKLASWILFNLLPQTIPSIHNGFELNEKLPVNTGLNFSKKDHEILREAPLPLFWKNALNWETKSGIIREIIFLESIKNKYPLIFDKENISLIETDNKKVCGFYKNHENTELIALFNTSFSRKEKFRLDKAHQGIWIDLIDNVDYNFGEECELVAGKAILCLR
jgi:starch synthase (maltosyl-transferring)